MYPLLVYIHVAATLTFMLAHGVSVAVAFALRRRREPEQIKALLALSAESYRAVYLSLLALLLSGIIAGFGGDWWGEGWIWLSLVLLIAIVVAMGILGGPVYSAVRQAAGLPYSVRGKEQPAEPPLSQAEVEARLARANPWLLVAVGYGGMLIILALMMFKPF